MGNRPHRAGTLAYTGWGLFNLFFWLIWGDIVFVLMEWVPNRIVPLRMHSLHASDLVLFVCLSSVPNLMNLVMTPIISFRSDRTRTPWGRRRPYLVLATPFIGLSLVAMGYSSEISAWLSHRIGRPAPLAAVEVGVLAVFSVAFQFAHLFVTSTYYCYFNDVVPEKFLGRFLAWFKVIGMATTSLLSWFILGKLETHARQVLVTSGVLYAVVFLVMCLMVREGEYPAPPQTVGRTRGFFAAARTYVAESFSPRTPRVYWYFFLANMFFWIPGVLSTFQLLNVKGHGVDLGTFGKAEGIFRLLFALAMIPVGWISDRKHPLNVYYVGLWIKLVTLPLGFVLLFPGFPRQWTPTVFLTLTGLNWILASMCTASQLPMFMRILPRDRYGQFSSANGTISNLAFVVAGPIAAGLLALTERFEPRPDFHYRYAVLWTYGCILLAFVFTRKLRREWQRLGGNEGYQPPEADLAARPAAARVVTAASEDGPDVEPAVAAPS